MFYISPIPSTPWLLHKASAAATDQTNLTREYIAPPLYQTKRTSRPCFGILVLRRLTLYGASLLVTLTCVGCWLEPVVLFSWRCDVCDIKKSRLTLLGKMYICVFMCTWKLGLARLSGWVRGAMMMKGKHDYVVGGQYRRTPSVPYTCRREMISLWTIN